MLVRRYISKALKEYYAQPANRVVGTPSVVPNQNDNDAVTTATTTTPRPINFKRLWGERHWKSKLGSIYDDNARHGGGRWLTPVELFQPYFSNCLANFLAAQVRLRSSNAAAKVDVIELGGGRGTNAKHVLRHLERAHPDVCERIHRYTIIDHSDTLLELQKQTIIGTNNDDDGTAAASDSIQSKVRFQLNDLLDIAEERTEFPLLPSQNLTVLIGMEILDNLPHDKVRVAANHRSRHHSKTMEQAEIDDHKDNNHKKEIFRPLDDPLLSRILRQLQPSSSYYTNSLSRGGSAVWIPTVACALLEKLNKTRPNSCVVLGDFDWLPAPDIVPIDNDDSSSASSSVWATGEPIITDMNGIDHECYLRAPPCCDILFPTDFYQLATFVEQSWKLPNHSRTQQPQPNTANTHKQQRVVDVMKQSDFLERYGPEQIEETKSWLTGYTPLLHDFGNCSMLTVGSSSSSSNNDAAAATTQHTN